MTGKWLAPHKTATLAAALLIFLAAAAPGRAQISGTNQINDDLELTDAQRTYFELQPPPEIRFRDFMFSTASDPRFGFFGLDFFAKFFDGIMKRGNRTLTAPNIEGVTVSPPNPTTWDVVSIEADISVDVDNVEDVAQEAVAYYRTDKDEAWDSTPMEFSETGYKWGVMLPPSPKAEEVKYFLLARDFVGNISTELPCKVSSWPPAGDPCMVPFAVDENIEERQNPQREAPELDIHFGKIGEDEKHFYVSLQANENIKSGTQTPMNLNVYYVTFFSSAKEKRQRFLTDTVTLLYNPLLERALEIPGCSAMFKPNEKWTASPMAVKCQAEGDTLYFRVDKDIFKEFKEPYAELLAGTFRILSGEPVLLRLSDATNFARAYFRERSYSKTPPVDLETGPREESDGEAPPSSE